MSGDRLVSAFLDGELDDETRRALDEWLRAEERQRDAFVLSAFVLQALLEEILEQPRDFQSEPQCELAAAVASDGRSASKASTGGGLAESVAERAPVPVDDSERRSWVFPLVAAVLLLAAGSPTLLAWLRADEIASVRVGPACVWAPAGEPLEDGDRVHAGDRLVLESGLVEVRFDSGIAVAVRGPAGMTVVDPLRCELDYGSIAAASAEGFTVGAGELRFVDLGTEFVVLSERTGTVEIDVLTGIVEAVLPTAVFDSPSVTIVEGRAFAFDTRTGEIRKAAHEPGRSSLLPRTGFQEANGEEPDATPAEATP